MRISIKQFVPSKLGHYFIFFNCCLVVFINYASEYFTLKHSLINLFHCQSQAQTPQV